MRRKAAEVVDVIQAEKRLIAFRDFGITIETVGGKTLRNVQILVEYDVDVSYL